MVQLGLALLKRHVARKFPVCSSTGGGYLLSRKKVIRFALKGCANRPFFHIVITNRWRSRDVPPFEQLGTFDPVQNDNNERLLTVNLERIRYWISQDVKFSSPVAELLGLIGFLPIHPRTRMLAWRGRQEQAQAAAKEQEEKNSTAAAV